VKHAYYSQRAFNWPADEVRYDYEEGAYAQGVTEPWVQQIVASLLIASNQRVVLELGCFLGHTTAWLARALEDSGGGQLIGIELDAGRAQHTRDLLEGMTLSQVVAQIHTADAIVALKQIPDQSIGFAWVDDDHTPEHVDEELTLLKPKMLPDGIICMHDVDGPIGLTEVCIKYGGYPLRFPHIGVAGGLGIIQC